MLTIVEKFIIVNKLIPVSITSRLLIAHEMKNPNAFKALGLFQYTGKSYCKALRFFNPGMGFFYPIKHSHHN